MPRKYTPRVPRVCERCGAVFTATPSDAAAGRGRFCSWACRCASRPRRALAERFWPKVEKTGGCWLWVGYRNASGYGQLRGDARAVLAHRASWEMANGPIPDGLHVLHHCDTPACVNPAHLYLGDDAANHVDMVVRGRSTRRERNPQARLTQAQVDAIRAAWAQGGITQTALGRRFGVSGACVCLIVNRQRWR
jgi:hypothetical protein